MSSPSQVAVFPLPKIVAFPGHNLQFHIFEPRYRRMVRDCVESGRWLAVAQGHLVKKPKLGQSLDEFLNSNQENYSPEDVFGAGPVKVLKEWPDGRSVIEVAIKDRFRRGKLLQELPYSIVEAARLSDKDCDLERERFLKQQLKADFCHCTIAHGTAQILGGGRFFASRFE
jgi:Lon protease-like protein